MLADLIRSRRTIGAFTPTPIEPETVAALLETAVWTPNHRMTEPWRFIIVTGEGRALYADARRRMVIAASRAADKAERQLAGDRVFARFAAIPAYLLVVQQQAAKADVREEDYAACAALIQNFMLLAWEVGIGTAWKTFADEPPLRALFGLRDDEKVVGIVHIGYPAETPTSTRAPLAERITFMTG
jgi:nitroreductase